HRVRPRPSEEGPGGDCGQDDTGDISGLPAGSPFRTGVRAGGKGRRLADRAFDPAVAASPPVADVARVPQAPFLTPRFGTAALYFGNHSPAKVARSTGVPAELAMSIAFTRQFARACAPTLVSLALAACSGQ